MSIDNLQRVLVQALPSDIETGRASYRKYNRIMCKLAAHCSTSTRTASAVFASLSPNNDYSGNLRDAFKLLSAHRDKRNIGDFTVSTYGQNKVKAWRIAGGCDPLELIVANKTRNFFLNVYNPDDPHPVTIDGHILNAWRGRRENLVGLKFPPKLYQTVAVDVRNLAAKQDMLPCQLQAILWVTWRRIHGILSTQQLEFWDADMLAARLGFQPVKA